VIWLIDILLLFLIDSLLRLLIGIIVAFKLLLKLA
jgi:hypothetical protein